MTLTRAVAEAAFLRAVIACDPTRLVRDALGDLASFDPAAPRVGFAAGKAAIAMARGAGPVREGLAIAPADDGRGLPAGWRLMIGAHPVPDARSLAAGNAAVTLFEQAPPDGDVIALISGGASSLMEVPRVPFDEYLAITSAVMAAGAPIHVLNLVRTALSRIKGGGLVAECGARVITLAISDVFGDWIGVIGSGPTVVELPPPPDLVEKTLRGVPLPPGAHDLLTARGPVAKAALAVKELGIDAPALEQLATRPYREPPRRIGDVARLLAPMRSFADAAARALDDARVLDRPLVGDVDRYAVQLVAEPGTVVAWGEPTLVVPEDHGEGGRAQQLALLLARELSGTDRAALVAGSDGVDGPAPVGRPAPAGAFVDGATWRAIIAAGLDPEVALARRDAGTALAAVGALFVPGPTGVNHADLVLIG